MSKEIEADTKPKRGRPKGKSNDKRSFGPLGDLIRHARLQKGMGLSDVAKACRCSIQFVSNIEHGRAPLPWDKAELLSKTLELSMDELQAANLAIRSDFKSFMKLSRGSRVSKANTALGQLKDAANLVALAAQDPELREIMIGYLNATEEAQLKFLSDARATLHIEEPKSSEAGH